MELMDKYSADSFRFLMLSSPLTNGENFALADKDVTDVARKLSMVWNMYDFFTLYAEVDRWEYDGVLKDPLPKLTNPLDVWVVSRLHQLIAEVEERTEAYDLQGALRPVLPFIEDASNWFVRRSRRRFWKSEDDGDKQDAYRTLHYVLVQLAHVMAPFTPFLAEELYHDLTNGESVHLRDWPAAGRIDEAVLQEMADVRAAIEQGLSQRAAAKIKVRQPLAKAVVHLPHVPAGKERANAYRQIVEEELNLKEVVLQAATENNVQVDLELRITPELKLEGMMREVVRNVQNARKQAGLNVDDRIELALSTTDKELRTAIETHKDTIAAETLTNVLVFDDDAKTFETSCMVEGAALKVSLQKS
jgi:isoleucyl-tRNA synthetase